MAELILDGSDLVLKLSTLEKMEGVHGDIRVPLSSVQSIAIVEDVIHAVHGLKMPGSRIPGVFAMGTFMSRNNTIFAIVHHQNKRGVQVRLQGAKYDALIVGVEEPEKLMKTLGF
ncbi:MAG: hypothetical protein M1294_11905 [Firmicutes bacterium]|uniref:Bacterial Pleckstrin homology domain-containing protein n=1 Tax=Sulfobacillus benefaciens TaxID=453960 RepID=A0A2T2WXN9_9FIRM|nr:hypothetical protein [Bacillota bacterium]MCL5013233.1 hypothetical protein [Bacillota bacterium]PSR27000.1 MAG: hypothetical protein C7B43_12590 [Sulfobacillus benefaciens]HBQ95348.1 hypothetical protein [Sulfobacillus sp.]